VVPLYKRGEKDAVENYRRISLLCTAYKIYAEVITNRLKKEVEEKSLVPENQIFEKGDQQCVHSEPRYAKRKETGR